MNKLSFLFLLAVVFPWGRAYAEDSPQFVWMVDGVYALALTDAWSYETREGDGRVILTHEDFDECVLVVDMPNPSYRDDGEEYLGLHIGYHYISLESEGRVFDVTESMLDDQYPFVAAAYFIPVPLHDGLLAYARVIDFDGYLVHMAAVGNANDMDGFLEAAQSVMDSYLFDEEDTEANRERLETIGRERLERMALDVEALDSDGTIAGLAGAVFRHYMGWRDGGEEAPTPYDVGDWGEAVLSEERNWTVLVYLDGDNDLEPYALRDLKEMEKGLAAATGSTVDVVVLFDRAKGFDSSWDDWTGTRVYHVVGDAGDEKFASELLHDCGELNMASIETLEDVRVALSRTAGQYVDGKLDLLVLDMCLMGQAETVVAVAPYVKYLVASPASIPSWGLDYERGLPLFADGGETVDIAVGLAAAALEGFRDHGRDDGTMAVYDLSATGGLLSSFGRLARKLNTLIPIAWPELTRSIFQALNYGGRLDLDERGGTISSIDLLHWLDRFERNADPALLRELRDDIDGVRKAVGRLVVHNERDVFTADSTGLAFYAPLREGNMDDRYYANSFGVYTAWSQVLADLYVEQQQNAGAPPRIASIEFGMPGASEPPGEITIAESVVYGRHGGLDGLARLTVDGVNILSVSGGVALSVPGTDGTEYMPLYRKHFTVSDMVFSNADQSNVDNLVPAFRNGRTVFTCRMDGLARALDNGSERTRVFAQYLDPANPDNAVILGELRRAGEEAWRGIVLETNRNRIIRVKAVDASEEGWTVSDIMPETDDVFRALLPVYDEDEEVTIHTDIETAWGENPTLVHGQCNPNQFIKIMCMAESLAGTGAVAFGEPLLLLEEEQLRKDRE
ncbi:MAG: clostripain-related cysteine peptidase [Planctomycetaceae bacterium]|nr:clostripain-related cysteine peptidase [Planctomycetaceae bacterium]